MNEKEIIQKHLKAIGKKGGINSAKSRFEGKTKEEISQRMREVALAKKLSPENID